MGPQFLRFDLSFSIFIFFLSVCLFVFFCFVRFKIPLFNQRTTFFFCSYALSLKSPQTSTLEEKKLNAKKMVCECICGFCTNLETIVVYADIHRIQVQQRSIALPFKIVTMLNNFASFIYSKSKYFTRKISLFEGVCFFGFCIRLCSQKSPLISPRTAELITFLFFFSFNFVLLLE